MPTIRAEARMIRRRHPLVIAAILALGLTLSGCETFEMPDWFNPKKPLPGERRAVFPEGVPGVQSGVPLELQQGYQPPPEPPPVVEAEKPKPKARPRPRQQLAAPAQQPQRPATAVTVQPTAQQQAPWQGPAQTASQP